MTIYCQLAEVKGLALPSEGFFRVNLVRENNLIEVTYSNPAPVAFIHSCETRCTKKKNSANVSS